jgi:hypothetical protein
MDTHKIVNKNIAKRDVAIETSPVPKKLHLKPLTK